jgi:hypothetical protein
VTIAAGSVVSAVVGVETLVVAVEVVEVVLAGVGDVATVAGAPQAAIASDETTSSDDNDFMGNPG